MYNINCIGIPVWSLIPIANAEIFEWRDKWAWHLLTIRIAHILGILQTLYGYDRDVSFVEILASKPGDPSQT